MSPEQAEALGDYINRASTCGVPTTMREAHQISSVMRMLFGIATGALVCTVEPAEKSVPEAAEAKPT